MAIQLHSLTTEHGIDIDNVYVRVESVSIPSKETLVFLASFHAKQNFPPVCSRQYSCKHIADGDNAIKQAYEYLKTLSEFADAVDC